MENKQQIQQANRKALPIYILIMVISALVGAGIGFLSGYYRLLYTALNHTKAIWM